MTAPPRNRARRQAGMTLIEILIATAVLVGMMAMAWTTISNTGEVRRTMIGVEERNHELRIAMARVVADLEAAYLSRNEDEFATDRRTLFVGKSGGDVPELRFSTLGHTALWGDANESEQTIVVYSAGPDRDEPTRTNWLRRELRRPSNKPWREEPADVDVLLRDIEQVTFEYFDWKDQEWRDQWDSTSDTGAKNRLPSRVRVTVTYRNWRDEETKIVTQAAILMQEPLLIIN
jgi:prepilin-type N-terminal cleavage/methylation domain-containing protein